MKRGHDEFGFLEQPRALGMICDEVWACVEQLGHLGAPTCNIQWALVVRAMKRTPLWARVLAITFAHRPRLSNSGRPAGPQRGRRDSIKPCGG